MKLKSFFANSIEDAIRQARNELGPDAMLVNSKRTGAEARNLGLYEIVVCVETPERQANAAARDRSASSAPDRKERSPAGAASVPVDRLSQDVSELKQRMEQLALTLARSRQGMASTAFDPDLSRAFTLLTDAELDTHLAYDIVGRMRSPVAELALRAEVAKLLRTEPELGVNGAQSRIVVLVGPPGAGKTSSLVKLAVQFGVAAGKNIEILTTDTYRIAAADELRSYSAILGIGCQVLETPGALMQAIQGCRQKDLIFVDTPGLCRFEMDAGEELAQVLATQPFFDTHLVLPASMRTADLNRVVEQYKIFVPRKLLFTRLDETEILGPILSLSARMAIPISYLSRGQRIPEDLEPATADLLLDQILGPLAAGTPKFDVVAA